jgi:hypothetical protein
MSLYIYVLDAQKNTSGITSDFGPERRNLHPPTTRPAQSSPNRRGPFHRAFPKPRAPHERSVRSYIDHHRMKTDFNTRYRFSIEVDQHGRQVPPTYFDRGEQKLISLFEETVIQEIEKTKTQELTMIELGSNQAYYSVLFRSMLRHHGIQGRSLMVEPYDQFMPRSLRHIEINEFDNCFFDRRSIGGEWKAWQNYQFTNGEATVDQLMSEYEMSHVNVLHSDIDGSEIIMLEGAQEALKARKISHIFILTHGPDLHQGCLDMLSQHDKNYDTIVSEDNGQHGTDGLIYARLRG